jgi:hypothetical protein
MDIVKNDEKQLVIQVKHPKSWVFTFGFGLVLGWLCFQIGLGSLQHNHGERVWCQRVEAGTAALCRLLPPAPLFDFGTKAATKEVKGDLNQVVLLVSERPQEPIILQFQFAHTVNAEVHFADRREAERHAQKITQFLATPHHLRLELELIGYGQIMTRTLAGYPLMILGLLLLSSFLIALLKWNDLNWLIFDRELDLYQVKYRYWWGLRRGIKYNVPLSSIASLSPVLITHQETEELEQADHALAQLRLHLQNGDNVPLNKEADLISTVERWQPIVNTINGFLQGKKQENG